MKMFKREKQSKELTDNSSKLLNDKTTFNIREAYNELRTNVMFSLIKEGCKKILVTSSMASEGKSTTCFNLAVSFAETGTKVLLIDCDLRRPNVGTLLKVKTEKKIGLSNYIVGDAKKEAVIRHSDYQNLDVMLAGVIPPNPTELLSSDKMKEIIEELSKEYDYIFFDTPPINIVTDAALLSGVVDGAIVVARQYVAERKLFVETINKLKFVNINVIGTVLNDIVASKSKYGYYKYDRYYSYEAEK